MINWIKEKLKRFKKWIIFSVLGVGVIFAAGEIMPDNIVANDLLECDKNKIIDSVDLDSTIKLYAYITDEIATGTLSIIVNERKKILTEEVSLRTRNQRVYKTGSTSPIIKNNRQIGTTTEWKGEVFDGTPFWQKNGKWYQTGEATTTKDAFIKQTKEVVGNYFIKKTTADETTYYSSSGDGSAYNYIVSSWTATHDDVDSSNFLESIRPESGKSSSGYFVISRGFVPFDTSGLGAAATISAASLFLYPSSVSNGDNDGDDWINIVQTNEASAGSPGTADYDLCGSVDNPTEGATRVDVGDITASQYNEWVLNATGIGWINKTGITQLGVREGHDALDSPYVGANNTSNRFLAYTSSETGTDKDPKLVVTYTTGDAARRVFTTE